MHILIIHQAFASLEEPGGTRHYELARYLLTRGHQVTVIASPVSYITGNTSVERTEHMEGLTVLRAKVYSAHHRSFLHRMLAFFSFMISSFWLGLWVQHVDVVWGTSPPIFQGVTAWALARIKGARFLFEVRDLWPRFAIAVGVLRNRWLISASEWLERFLYRSADRIMVNSPGFVHHVEARGGRDVELIPNGADPSMFNPGERGVTYRQANGLDDRYVVMYAGAHGLSNDLGVVLEAARLLKDRPQIQIALVGDGKERPALMAQAAAMGLPNVCFLAPVPKSVMREALAAADACIAILKPLEDYKTTYPNKVFDYMAAGRPVALAIDGVIRQVVEAAGCGFFAEPGDPHALSEAIRMLAQNPEKSREMGLAGRRYLEENFSRGRMAERLLQLLEQMVKGRRDDGMNKETER
ncbi:MAG: glycosyltransferase family 4 protein [Bacteroidota bacterium]